MEGICCRAYLDTHTTWLGSSPSFLPIRDIVDSAVNLSFVLDAVRSCSFVLVFFFFPICVRAHTADFDAVFALVVHVLLMAILIYFNSFLTVFRALPSADLSENASALFQATTAVLPLKKEIGKLKIVRSIHVLSVLLKLIFLLVLLWGFLSFFTQLQRTHY